MVTTLRRGPRLEPPRVPEGQVALQPPPETAPHEGSGAALMMALPMLGSVGSIVFVATSQRGPTGYLAAGMFLVAALGFVGVSVWRQRAQRHTKSADQRREYLHYLTQVRATARQAAKDQREALLWDHPEPAHLPALAEERTRVWERQPGDADFLQVRYGLAPQPLSLTLTPPDVGPLDRLDPVAASALHRLLATHRVQPDLPASLDLRAFARIEMTGHAEKVRALARSMVCSAATFHAPEHLLVAVVAGEDSIRAWEWTKWLPHTGSPRERDGAGPSRLVATSLDELIPLLPGDLHERPRWMPGDGAQYPPHVLLVVDGGHVPPGNPVLTEDGVQGVTVLDLPEYWGELEDESRLRLHVADVEREDGRTSLRALRVRQDAVEAVGDQVDPASAEALARRLTPLFVSGSSATDGSSASSDLMDLLALPHVTDLDVSAAWRPRPARDQLRVPVGLSDDGSPVYLDIKESAQQGMGPHGLVIGATGSGKSEFLRTLVLALSLTHSPEQLNLVLVDFKGGATFAGMADMPHVSAVITNLAQELTLVDRMRDALSGEMTRRQELLRASGNYQNVRDYEKARQQGADLEPLPHLFVCVDEFSELLSAKPEFIDLFGAIGRLGRSLGVHLLLASQRLEEGRLRGLDSHLSYRVGLRTFSGSESRTVLGVPDAYELPPVPGLGILKPDPATYTRFMASYVSGPPAQKASRSRRVSAGTHEIVPFTLGPVARPASFDLAPEPVSPSATGPEDSRTTLDLAVERMRGQGPRAHQVWLPPLDVPATLDQLMPDLAPEPGLGLVSKAWRGSGTLRVPLGLVDKPLEQEREALVVDLSGGAGHAAIVGAPLAGKSTLARALVASLALTHTPQEVQFYVLDFGGAFAGMTALPHLTGTAGRSEPEVVRRIVAEVKGIVDAREAFFRRHDIDSVETYRARRGPGGPDDGYGDVFLVVDGWSTLRAEFDTLELELQDLAQRGLTFGVHLLTTTTRWSDYRTAMRDLFGTRLELRLGDPLDSEIDRRVSVNVPKDRPGRGILPSRHHFLGVLPRLDGHAHGGSVADGLASLVSAVRDAWGGPSGPRLRLLPTMERLEATYERAGGADALDRRLVLGVDEKDLAAVRLDVDAEPLMLVFGEAESGKTGFLRTYIREVMRTRTPDEAKLVVFDYRRKLLGEVPQHYAAGYLSSGSQAEPEMRALNQYVAGRLPGTDVTPQQLRDRSWWSGPDVFVVVDDYDLVSTSMGSPLQPLVDLLPQAGDVGLHLLVARRSGGASRALYEPVIQSLRDLSMPGVLLPGDPSEGQLIGSLRPKPGPPGRAQLLTRSRGSEVVQVSWTDPAL
ncbi:MAG: type VII secretion protein EccCa [Actinomycetes bacterium]